MTGAVRAGAWALASALCVGLAGCSSLLSITNLFAADKPKPKPLDPIAAPIAGRAVWNLRVESVQFPLVVAVNGGVFTVAGTDGTVLAVQADTGREVWRAQVGARLSAGVGSDGRYAAVVTRSGELVVLDGGQVKWRKALGARVTTPPLVAGERVFVLGVDRAVQAFDAADGSKLWTLQRPGDPLTLAQSGVLTPYRDTLLAGQGPRLTGIDPLRGAVRWDVAIGSPRGANEVERLADLVGPVGRVGELVCARSFQAAVGCVNAERGTLAWTKNVGGTDAVSADAQYVFGADASDRLTAWKIGNGDIAWTSEKLLYRALSAPLVVDKSVVYGDADGMVHWLARDTGEAQLRLPTDGSRVVAAPVAAGTTVLVVTRNGGLFAFRPQ